MNKTVLITGGAGYIGSHTCKLLKQSGLEPVVYDNLVYGHQDLVRWGPFCEGDILDAGRLDEVFRRFQPHAVVHFAAYAYVGESVADPIKYYRNNVIGTLSLLEAMLRNDCRKIVFSSSCATYGIPQQVPISEDVLRNPINPYGRSKLMIEQVLVDYQRAYNLQNVILRYFNAAGADLEGETGEDHTPETHLIPLVLNVALGRREHIEVFGVDYETVDGTAVRDYVHVTDLADAHVKALAYINEAKRSDHFNLGSGAGVSVKNVIDSVANITGAKIPVVFASRRLGDPPVLIADASKATHILGWKPKFSKLETIIKTAWRWQKARDGNH